MDVMFGVLSAFTITISFRSKIVLAIPAPTIKTFAEVAALDWIVTFLIMFFAEVIEPSSLTKVIFGVPVYPFKAIWCLIT